MFVILKYISITLAKRMDAVFALFVIGIVFMMILPMPTWLVDILIALNISISSLLIVMALYMPGPLAFSTFPAFLLITTLFRLGLSITTTRLILLQADAGEIVEAFGNFVVGGNLVVGIVIFMILLVVNFLVITKGSERVAEVSARFTLDAMPGKQMSIDSDLRGGLLSSEEAQLKRKTLAKESQLFGAMDGAMKFVKGDAIAGIIIVFVNIIGGFSIGTLQQGMSGSEAIKLYSILTIGDGLVAQIPTLLIALSAGMIITRVKDDVLDTQNIGMELSKQLSSEPKAWVISSGVLLIFAMVPGMPSAAFIVLSLIFLSVGGVNIYLENMDSGREKAVRKEEKVEDGKSDVSNFDVYEPMTYVVNTEHYGTELFENLGISIRKRRNNLVANYGYILPPISYEVRSNIEYNNFQFRFYEDIVVNSSLNIQFISVSREYITNIEECGIEYEIGRKEYEEDHLLWVRHEMSGMLDENSIPYKDCLQIIGEKSYSAMKHEGHQFLGIDEVKKILAWLSKANPELVKEIEKIFPMAKISEILRNLLKENISLRSLRKIFELIVKHGENERDIIDVTEMVRMGIRDQLCSHITGGKTLSVVGLDADYEMFFRDRLRKTVSGGYFEISEDEKHEYMTEVQELYETHYSPECPVALVVSPDIRPFMRGLTATNMPDLPVLSITEISAKVSVSLIHRITPKALL